MERMSGCTSQAYWQPVYVSKLSATPPRRNPPAADTPLLQHTRFRVYATAMRTTSLILLVAAVAISGCGRSGSDSSQSTNSTSSGNPVTAPLDYLEAVGNAKQRSIATIDVASLTQAIQMFNVSEGRFPTDLNELVSKGYMSRIPDAPYRQKIVYDPTTGEVKVVPQ